MPRALVGGIVALLIGLALMLGIAPVVDSPGDTIVWWLGLILAIRGACAALWGAASLLGLTSRRP